MFTKHSVLLMYICLVYHVTRTTTVNVGTTFLANLDNMSLLLKYYLYYTMNISAGTNHVVGNHHQTPEISDHAQFILLFQIV